MVNQDQNFDKFSVPNVNDEAVWSMEDIRINNEVITNIVRMSTLQSQWSSRRRWSVHHIPFEQVI
jgi:hypothetical protein